MRLHSIYQLILLLCAFVAADATAKCDRSLITGVTDDQIHFDNGTKGVMCRSGENSLMAIQFASKLYSFLVCDEVNGWKEGDDEHEEKKNDWIADASTPLDVKCVEYCASTGSIAVKKFEILGNTPSIDISCADPTLELFSAQGLRRAGYTTCALKEGWFTSYYELNNPRHVDESITTATASSQHFECRKAPCSVLPDFGVQTYFGSNKTVACRFTTDYKLIKVASKLYESLSCDEANGWRNNAMEKVADASSALAATCVEYCTWTGPGLIKKDARYYESDSVKISCKNSRHGLYHDRGLMGVQMKCSRKSGWETSEPRNDYRFSGVTNDIISTLHFECREHPPCSFYFNEFAHFDKETKTLTCSKENSLIYFWLGEGISAPLKCDDSAGWTYIHRKMAESNVPLAFNCLEYCASTGPGIRSIEGSSVNVTCPGDQLYYREKHIPGGASCGPDRGWVMTSSSDVFESGNVKPVQLDCRQESTTVPTTVEDSEDGNGALGSRCSIAICIVISAIALLLTIN